MNWQALKQTSLEEILSWAETQPWAEEMAKCRQDSQWHAEGDVWTHTKMVCRQLPLLEQWDDLTTHEQQLLVFTALFHDSAKPRTSLVDPESGRIRSPGHSIKGERLARNELRRLGCDLQTREQISRMVRVHGRPVFLSERSEPTHEVVRMSCHVQNRLLYFFALADTRGRDSQSESRPEEELHYWKLVSEECGCYRQPYPFASDHARFTFFRSSKPNLHYVPHDAHRCTVTMMAGLPGSGKDTWLDRYHGDDPVVALDDIRAETGVDPTEDQGQVVQTARERCREWLRAGQSFAFNATNLLRQTRRRWIELFADYDARIEIVYLEPAWDQLRQQNRDRANAVPDNVLAKMAKQCEPPSVPECHRLILAESVDA